jgi:hypothetical protein
LDDFLRGNGIEILELACHIFNLNENQKDFSKKRYLVEKLAFQDFAPYAAFCLKIDLLFYLGVHFNLISSDRPSHRIDISYLYYLPFCMVFVSNDRLHKLTAPLFMELGQTFVSGDDFKRALRELDEYYSKLPDEVKERGVLSFAQYPPTDITNLISELWDKHMSPKWREMKDESERKIRDPEEDKKTVKKLKLEQETSTPIPDRISLEEADQVFLTHLVPPIRGKWKLFSQDIIDESIKVKE